MFAKFRYEPLPLGSITLDERNPRIVTPAPLTSQPDILEYLFEHENLFALIRKIAHEGKNRGAERPYVVKKSSKYTVVEGNRRIAAYKVLTGLLIAPAAFKDQIPDISEDVKATLLVVECTIAPNRDTLLSIMADSHFGLGDKSRWGYLGSRKAVFDEHEGGKTLSQLARAFSRSQTDIVEFMMEFLVYQEALALNWSGSEKEKLLRPSLEFNPPVRFLQTKGHKELIGISYDRTNLKVVFHDAEAKRKFAHLIRKLVLHPQQGLGATAAYDQVFLDYVQPGPPAPPAPPPSPPPPSPPPGPTLKAGALFNYPVSAHNNLLRQLMKEASEINAKKLPASATFLLRNLLEALLKHVIEQSGANPTKASLNLDIAIGICKGKKVPLSTDDKKILKDFESHHLSYVNLGAHGNLVPHADRVFQIRDLLDQFIKKNI